MIWQENSDTGSKDFVHKNEGRVVLGSLVSSELWKVLRFLQPNIHEHFLPRPPPETFQSNSSDILAKLCTNLNMRTAHYRMFVCLGLRRFNTIKTAPTAFSSGSLCATRTAMASTVAKKPIVYSIPVCPFCQRLQIQLELKNIPDAVDFIVVDSTKPRPPELLAKTREERLLSLSWRPQKTAT
jgi:hypothetical protein